MKKMFYVDVEYITFPLPFVKTQVYLDFPVYVYRVNSGTQSMAIGNMVKNRAMHLAMLKHEWDFIKTLPPETSSVVKKSIETKIFRAHSCSIRCKSINSRKNSSSKRNPGFHKFF